MSIKNKLRILVACECSQRVCRAFRKLGHEAYSCDIQPAYCPDGGVPKPEWHILGDALDHIDKGWDLLIAHPPCTYTGVVSNRYLYHPDDKHLPTSERRPHPNHPHRAQKRKDGAAFAKKLFDAPVKYIALEHPRSVLTAVLGHPQQWVEPYWFGISPNQKKTGWWIRGGLPDLKATGMLTPEFKKDKKGRPVNKWHRDTSGLPPAACSRKRSCLCPGMAKAIAEQWSAAVLRLEGYDDDISHAVAENVAPSPQIQVKHEREGKGISICITINM